MVDVRITAPQIREYAARFPVASDFDVENKIARPAKKRGYLTADEFFRLCEWKSPRSRPLVRSNPESRIEEATRLALAASDDALKIGILLVLRGVSWPTASVILHWCDGQPYPILDVRALWTMGYATPPVYTTGLWLEYVTATRSLAEEAGTDMRTLDRALWQYSKEHQSAG